MIIFVPNAAFVSSSSVNDDFFMTTRYAGRLYVRGWISESDVNAVRDGRQFTLRRDDNFAHAVFLTLPLQYRNAVTGERLLKALTNNLQGLDEGAVVIPADAGTLTDNNRSLNSGVDVPNGIFIPGGIGLEIDSHAWDDFTKTAALGSAKALETMPADQFIVGLPGWHLPFDRAVYPDFDASSVLCRVKDLPEGHPVHVSHMTLTQLTPSRSFPPSSNDAGENCLVDIRPDWWRPYTIIKQNDLLYLRCWAAPVADGQSVSYPMRFFTGPGTSASGAKRVQIQVPLQWCTLGFDRQSGKDNSLVVDHAPFDRFERVNTTTSDASQVGSEDGSAQQ